MGQIVCTIGARFSGYCSACQGTVWGTMETGEFPTIEGKNICVTDSIGRGDCGHTCKAIGLSQVWKIEGKPVARVSDPVTGTIVGKLEAPAPGADFVTSD